MLTADYVRSLLSYDERTGNLHWRKAVAQCVRVGDVAGSICKNGYVAVGIDGKVYKAHRLIWLIKTGAFPKDMIDHIDGDKSNNLWSNFRLATNGQNKANGSRYRNNKCGLKGVCFYPQNGKWLAQISSGGKRRHIGYFNCPGAAHIAYCREAMKLHKEFARFS